MNVMKNKLLFVSLFLLYCLSRADAQTAFHRVYESGINESSRDVVPTSDGGYLIAAMKEAGGDTDLYIVKTNSYGLIQWTKTYGGTHPDYPYEMISSGDGNFLIIGFTASRGAGGNDTWLLKINP